MSQARMVAALVASLEERPELWRREEPETYVSMNDVRLRRLRTGLAATVWAVVHDDWTVEVRDADQNQALTRAVGNWAQARSEAVARTVASLLEAVVVARG